MAVVRKRGKRFVFDYRLNGSRQRVTCETKDEAQDLCEKYIALRRAERLREFQDVINARKALQHLEISLSGKPLKEAVLAYIETCSKLKSAQTQKCERIDFKNLYDFLHKERDVYYLKEVTPQLLEEFQGRLFQRTSGSSCNRRFNSYKHFFNKCVEWGFLEKSPATFLKRKRERANPRKTFLDEEVRRIAKSLPDYLARPFIFFAAAGVRPGEGLSPRFKDWDRAAGTLMVESDKNASVCRTVYLNETAQAILESTHVERVNVKPSDLIFLNTRKRALRPAVLTKAVRLACRKLGIEAGKTPYGLRHTFATKHAQLDVSSEKTKRLMGHSSIRTTEKYYKLGETELKETVAEVAKVFDFQTREEIKTVTDGHKVS